MLTRPSSTTGAPPRYQSWLASLSVELGVVDAASPLLLTVEAPIRPDHAFVGGTPLGKDFLANGRPDAYLCQENESCATSCSAASRIHRSVCPTYGLRLEG